VNAPAPSIATNTEKGLLLRYISLGGIAKNVSTPVKSITPATIKIAAKSLTYRVPFGTYPLYLRAFFHGLF
jgi:hypothetical protein